jgi:hypothetical protein
MAASLRAQLLEQSASLRAAAAALSAAGDAAVPACRLGARAPPHADHALHLVLLMAHAMVAAHDDATSARHGAAAQLGRPLSGPERAHVADCGAVAHALHAFLSPAQSALARLRLGSGREYLDASIVVMDQLAAMLGALTTANDVRVAALGARAAGAPHGVRVTFFERLASNGVMSSAPQQPAANSLVACAGT